MKMKNLNLMLCLLLLGCGSSETSTLPAPDGSVPAMDGTSQLQEDGGPQSDLEAETDASTPTDCVPDSTFCYQGQIRKCNSRGTDSVMDKDCTSLNFQAVTYTCEECSDGTAQCGPAVPWTSGSVNGHFSFVYESGDPGREAENLGCEPSARRTTNYIDHNGVFDHHSSEVKQPAVIVSLKQFNTKGKEMLFTCDNYDGSFSFTTKDYDQWGTMCHKGRDGDQEHPPKMLSVVFVAHSSAQPPEYGSKWTLNMEGYVRNYRDTSLSPKWVPFFYEAEGVFTYGPNK